MTSFTKKNHKNSSNCNLAKQTLFLGFDKKKLFGHNLTITMLDKTKLGEIE
jgi:hypothetical protein